MTGEERRLPIDALVVVLGVVVLYVTSMTLGPANPVRILVGLFGLLVLPGYAVTTAVYPARSRPDPRRGGAIGGDEGVYGALSPTKRAAMSVGVSVALFPVYGGVLALFGLPFSRRWALVLVSGATVLGAVLGFVRRLSVPPADRYVPAPGRALERARADLADRPTTEVALTVAVVVVALIATSTMAYAITAPNDGSEYTQANLLTQSNGSLVLSDYPTEMVAGQQTDANLVVEVQNHHDERKQYTVVVQLLRVGPNGQVTERATVDRFREAVRPGGEWRKQHEVTPPFPTDRGRLVYYVYEGQVQGTPSKQEAVRTVSLSVSVDSGGGSEE